MLRCPNCKEKIARFPLRDSNGKLIIKNLFKMDLVSIMWIAVIIFIAITYKGETETCREIVADPLTYCEESNACKIIEERKRPFGTIDIGNIPEFNITDE